jgi:hypothetical protein
MAERLQILQHAHKVVHQNAQEQGVKYKANFDSKTAQHNSQLGKKFG